MSGLRTIEQDWECSLSPLPKRVLLNDFVTMTVTLSSRGGRPLTPADYNSFNYAFSADDPRLDVTVSGLTGNVTTGPLSFTANTFNVPQLPDGSYQLSVRVTPNATLAAGLPPFPADGVSGEAILTSVAHETTGRSAVTLQRTGTYPTRDQLLWVAIRNRTSALDFTRYQ